MDRITAIRTSLTAYACGIIGLLPVIGFPFGVAAVVIFLRVQRQQSTGWNPAERYLGWGVRFALIGVVLSLLCIALVMAISIQQGMEADSARSDWGI